MTLTDTQINRRRRIARIKKTGTIADTDVKALKRSKHVNRNGAVAQILKAFKRK